MPRYAAVAWLLLAMVLWGSAFPSSRSAVGFVPHEVAALLRFGGGAVVLVVLLLILRPARLPARKDVLLAVVAGIVGVFGYNALFFYGVSLAPASDGSVIFPALTPVITMTVLVLVRIETVTWLRVAGLLLGVVGAAAFFLATEGTSTAGSARLLGDGVFVVGAFVWSAYTLLNRRVLRDIDPLWAVTIGTVAGSVLLGALAAPEFGQVQWSALGTGFWVNAVYLAIGPTAVAYILFANGIRAVGAGVAATMMFAVPVFGTLFSFVFLGESFSLYQALAAVVMVGGALLAVRAGTRATATPPAAAVPEDVPAGLREGGVAVGPARDATADDERSGA